MEALYGKLSSHNTSVSENMLNLRKHVGGIGDVYKDGNVVKSFTIGNTKIKICDDYCRERTPTDVQAILNRIALRAQAQLSSYSTTQKNN